MPHWVLGTDLSREPSSTLPSCSMWHFFLVVLSLRLDTDTCGDCRTSGDKAGTKPEAGAGKRHGPTCVAPGKAGIAKTAQPISGASSTESFPSFPW